MRSFSCIRGMFIISPEVKYRILNPEKIVLEIIEVQLKE